MRDRAGKTAASIILIFAVQIAGQYGVGQQGNRDGFADYVLAPILDSVPARSRLMFAPWRQ